MELLQVGGPLLMAVVHATSPMSVWTAEACDQCGWSSPFLECNVSIDDRLVQWNTFPCHRWGISMDNIWECLTMVCHQMTACWVRHCTYNIVRCISLNLERLLQIVKGEYWSWAQAMLQIIKCLLLFLPPRKIFPTTTLGHLAEGPCNMGESQHEPSIEVGQSQEALKLS